ncbi:hypothetical protein GCM10025863_32080 [Microbacterium suwonense]|uniref:Flp pilus-assembly TadG-like N-terminal domain-containing protein n=2 Tax=Microbacterium suwonense TaxID=683047 RepID=A0ABN6X7B9_9MICO|nr:hypothetical protein GCM10025863_32080 [Microbacterium suwonense]
MLVNTPPAHRRSDERGSTLISVLVIMLVMSIGALTVGAVVVNTTGMLVDARSTTQSRAAADAGLADAVTAAQRSGQFCDLDFAPDAADPVFGLGKRGNYHVTSTCDTAAGTVAFTATGTVDGAKTTTESVYSYSTAHTGHGADMVFYSDATFTAEVLTSAADSSLLSIVIPSGKFTCQVHIPANIVIAKGFESKGNCTVDGSVIAGGTAAMAVSSDTIKGNLSASSESDHTINGKVLGDIHLGGPLSGTGGSSFTFPGNVSVRGDANIGGTSIGGTLTLPRRAS